MSELTAVLLPCYNAAPTGTRPFLAVWRFAAALRFWNHHHSLLRRVPDPRPWLSVVLKMRSTGRIRERRACGVAATLQYSDCGCAGKHSGRGVRGRTVARGDADSSRSYLRQRALVTTPVSRC